MKEDFSALLVRKARSLTAVVGAAAILAALMWLLWRCCAAFLPQELTARCRALLALIAHEPEQLKEWLSSAPWLFVLAQVIQVIAAPIPGQAVAALGGYVFGFWRGWLLTTIGLTIGSFIAMALARVFGEKIVRRFVPAPTLERFDDLLADGGYSAFFMIFLLPALPDDAVCFIAGLTRRRLAPLTLVCLLGRAPGMAVLSLLGAGFGDGLPLRLKILFAAMMAASVPLWLFWERLIPQREKRPDKHKP